MLDKLNEVQSRDLDLLALEEERGRTPPELLEMRRRKESLETALAAVQQKHHALRQEVSSNELELKSLESRRKTAADSAAASQNSKEMAQYQNQELQFATRVQELEEDTLPLMERLESLEAERDGLKAELAALEPQLDAVMQAEQERVNGIDEKLRTLESEREALARDIDPGLLKQYEQVRRSKRGLGLVPVVGNQRCGGCNMRLPIHVLQKANSSSSVTRCPSCGRILWAK